MDDGALLQQVINQIDRYRVADVVGVRLKGQAPDCNAFVPQDLEGYSDLLQKPLAL